MTAQLITEAITTVHYTINQTQGCLRCGKCCFYQLPDGRVKRCKHMVFNRKMGKSICRSWVERNNKLRNGENLVIDTVETRFGKKQVVCITRQQDRNDHIGCPLNTGKPIAPWEF